MKQHRLLQENNAFKQYPNFNKKVMDIIQGERFSEMKRRSVTKLEVAFTDYSDLEEDTFLNAIIPLVIKESHVIEKSIPKTFNEALMIGNEETEVKHPKPGVTYLARL